MPTPTNRSAPKGRGKRTGAKGGGKSATANAARKPARARAASGAGRAAARAGRAKTVNGGPARTTRAKAGDGRPPQREPRGAVQKLIARRVANATSVDGPDLTLARTQGPIWNLLCDRYFRVEIDGWERLPDEPSLLIGVHAGAALTIDAWVLVFSWWRRFGEERILHGTAHDVLMATPGLGDYFRLCGVIPASRTGVGAALGAGHDVIVWPGGEQDSMRSWRKRDKVVLAGRRGFVRQAMRSGVPIVPVATVGGADTVFVLSEGRWLARVTGIGRRLRGATLPIVLGFPFGITPEILPVHVPLPSKIRYEILEPIRVDTDPARADDREYVDSVYHEVEDALQAGMDRLAARRRFPIFG
jgi:1-acyl-sn-glycerol-3-phosphate acyltransferase